MSETPRGITAQQAIEHARYTVMGSNGQFPTHIDPLGLVNEAGEWLVSSYEWAWCTSRVTTLGIKAGQDYATLPDDFGGNLAQEHTDSLTYRLTLVSLADLLQLKTGTIAWSGNNYVAAIGYGRPASGGEPVPRLLLYPTPQESDVDAFTIIYTARWSYVGEASDYLVLPGYCVALYLDILVHFARGRMEEDSGGTVATRLQGMRGSDLFMAAVNMDARTQSDYGRMSNTHTHRDFTSNYWPDNWGFVAPPS